MKNCRVIVVASLLIVVFSTVSKSETWICSPDYQALPSFQGNAQNFKCIAVPGDFNGDGKTDAAVYKTDFKAWFIDTADAHPNEILYSSPVFSGVSTNTAIPLAADINGDGYDDLV